MHYGITSHSNDFSLKFTHNNIKWWIYSNWSDNFINFLYALEKTGASELLIFLIFNIQLTQHTTENLIEIIITFYKL